jgi:hypothetical protein
MEKHTVKPLSCVTHNKEHTTKIWIVNFERQKDLLLVFGVLDKIGKENKKKKYLQTLPLAAPRLPPRLQLPPPPPPPPGDHCHHETVATAAATNQGERGARLGYSSNYVFFYNCA